MSRVLLNIFKIIKIENKNGSIYQTFLNHLYKIYNYMLCQDKERVKKESNLLLRKAKDLFSILNKNLKKIHSRN